MNTLKILFCLLLLVFATVVRGQNTQTTNQQGTDKDAEITQRGRNLNSFVEQTGAGSATAVVNQSNSRTGTNTGAQQATLFQISVSGSNIATIVQVAIGAAANTVSLTQTNATSSIANVASVSQTGQALNATARQTGSGNQLVFVQTGNGGSSNGMQAGNSNLVNVSQLGNSGSSASPNQVFIQQLSDNNTAYVSQAVFGGTNSNNQLTLTQSTGAGNRAGLPGEPLLQQGSSNAATIAQTGTANTLSSFTQTNGATATINQLGDGGLVTAISQTGANALFIAQIAGSISNTVASVSQSGGGNGIQITQNGSSQQVYDLTQTGTDNRIVIAQGNSTTGTGGQVGRVTGGALQEGITQSGLSNSVTITQTQAAQVWNVDETGNNNALTISQTGTGINNLVHNARIVGNNNRVGIGQPGAANNVVSFDISGVASNSNVIGITQNGSGNSIGTAAATGSEGLVINGSSNSLSISQNQTGPATGNSVNAGITGNSNVVTISQTGSGNTIGTGAGSTGPGNTRGLTITGDANAVSMAQTGNTNTASATMNTGQSQIDLVQTGTDNASIGQLGNVAAGQNKVFLSQQDGFNEATILQTGSNNYVGGLGSSLAAPDYAAQKQVSGNVASANRAFVTQANTGQTALFQQQGMSNVMIAVQN